MKKQHVKRSFQSDIAPPIFFRFWRFKTVYCWGFLSRVLARDFSQRSFESRKLIRLIFEKWNVERIIKKWTVRTCNGSVIAFHAKHAAE